MRGNEKRDGRAAMKITEERIEEGGVKRTSFTLEVAGESVPGVAGAVHRSATGLWPGRFPRRLRVRR